MKRRRTSMASNVLHIHGVNDEGRPKSFMVSVQHSILAFPQKIQRSLIINHVLCSRAELLVPFDDSIDCLNEVFLRYAL